VKTLAARAAASVPWDNRSRRTPAMVSKPHSPYDLTDLTKMMQDFQIPGVDWQDLMASQQKNVAALTRANQVLMEGAQAVFQREVEILQKAMSEVVDASRELMQEGDPQANASKRFELARTSFEAAIGNMRELAEMAAKSNREALELINQRALESFDEVRKALEQKKQ
jgi:phasin family protein